MSDLPFISPGVALDHETRIRSIERWRGRVEGAIAASMFMASTSLVVTGIVVRFIPLAVR